MRRLLAVTLCCSLSLGGCDFLRLIVPRHPTTPAEARRAMERCGVSPDRVAWKVLADGSFAFGRAAGDVPPLNERQIDCLMQWAEDNRVDVSFIGRETDSR